MPTYAYECQACGHGFEEFQSMSANALRKCPECKKLKLQRLIGPGAGIIFKGSGFYETDYRSDAYEKSRKSDIETSTSTDKSKAKDKSDGKDKSEGKGKPDTKKSPPKD